MARIVTGSLTTFNLSTHLDPQTADLYGIADYFSTPGYVGASPKAWLNGSDNWAFGSASAEWTGGFAKVASYSNGATGRALSAWFAHNSAGSAILARVDYTAGALATFYFGSGTGVGSISTNGTTTAYNTSSDGRLKENVTDSVVDSGAVIDAIQVRAFDWISDSSHTRASFVAQELAVVVPEAVTVGDAGSDPYAAGARIWGVDPGKLVPILVKELQALRARVAALEAP